MSVRVLFADVRCKEVKVVQKCPDLSGVVFPDASIDITSAVADLETQLEAMELGPLMGLWLQSMFVGLTMWALTICIFIIVYGRMIEVYLVTSMTPVPMAAMMGKPNMSSVKSVVMTTPSDKQKDLSEGVTHCLNSNHIDILSCKTNAK